MANDKNNAFSDTAKRGRTTFEAHGRTATYLRVSGTAVSCERARCERQ